MPSGRDYANRLLEETNRTFAPHLTALQEALQGLRNHLTASLEQLAPKLESIKTVEMAATGNILSEAIEEVNRQRQQDIAFIVDFCRDLRKKETQEEILTFLLDSSCRYASRVAFFAVRGNLFMGWSSRGYSDGIAEKIQSSSIESSASPAFQRAACTDRSITITEVAAEDALSQYLPVEPANTCHLLPMRAMNRTVAIVVAADTADQHCDVNALRILLDLTSLYTENMALRVLSEATPPDTMATGTGKIGMTAGPVEQAVPAPPTILAAPVPLVEQPPATPPGAEAAATAFPFEPDRLPVQEAPPEPDIKAEPAPAIVIPEEHPPAPQVKGAGGVGWAFYRSSSEAPAASAVPVVEPAVDSPAGLRQVPTGEDVDREVNAWLATIGKLAPATGPVPAEDSKKAAPAVIHHESAPVAAPSAGEPRVISEEEKAHADARRFARLLVSEIKLYNEQRLLEGRENRDIYVRLKRDIDKSREMYERRVPSNVAHKFDYFNDEIVRILAENDSTKLGSDYPGPRVEG